MTYLTTALSGMPRRFDEDADAHGRNGERRDQRAHRAERLFQARAETMTRAKIAGTRPARSHKCRKGEQPAMIMTKRSQKEGRRARASSAGLIEYQGRPT